MDSVIQTGVTTGRFGVNSVAKAGRAACSVGAAVESVGDFQTQDQEKTMNDGEDHRLRTPRRMMYSCTRSM